MPDPAIEQRFATLERQINDLEKRLAGIPGEVSAPPRIVGRLRAKLTATLAKNGSAEGALIQRETSPGSFEDTGQTVTIYEDGFLASADSPLAVDDVVRAVQYDNSDTWYLDNARCDE